MSGRVAAPDYRTLFAMLPTGILVADDTATYVDANPAACVLLGRARGEIVGRHVSDIVAPNRRAEVNVQWASFIRDGSQRGLFAIRLPDGTSRQLYFAARANFLPGLHCSVLTADVPAEDAAAPVYADLTLCPWSKRVQHLGQWMPIEQYLESVHGLTVRHSASPDALAHGYSGSRGRQQP